MAIEGISGPDNVNVAEGVRRESGGAVYVVSVSGPKAYPLQQTWELPRLASGVQLFQVIHVDLDEIRYEARLATGELYDAFVLLKDDTDAKKLIEQPTDVDEIRE